MDYTDNWLSSFNRNRPIEKGLGDFYLNRATYPISDQQKKVAHDLVRIRKELIELCCKTQEISANIAPTNDYLFNLRTCLDGIETMVYEEQVTPPDRKKIEKVAAAIAKNIQLAAQFLAKADKHIIDSLHFSGEYYCITKKSLLGEPVNYDTIEGIHALFEYLATRMEEIPYKLKYKYRDKALASLNHLYSELICSRPKRKTSHKDLKKTQQDGHALAFVRSGAMILGLGRGLTDNIIDTSIKKAQHRYDDTEKFLKAISSVRIESQKFMVKK